ncbi:MAG TPA: Asp-tRNA(Asn)/Glu-tRNA(Gln) amidotransferase subunit GatC [Vicinamibacterales bacterium]|nr:Asp-tRNA(Asn)/Glu-tRNA(Gln) amidotransferase subunit GatC [Vicinamibacterales bacterium]
MAKVLTPADVERVAALAHLELTDEEKTLFTQQLDAILAYADEVRQIDTTGVPPTSHVLSRQSRERPDEVRPSLPREESLAAAPEPAVAAGLFKVPRVIG